MHSALQRLLSRPSSLDLLEILTRSSGAELFYAPANRTINRRCLHGVHSAYVLQSEQLESPSKAQGYHPLTKKIETPPVRSKSFQQRSLVANTSDLSTRDLLAPTRHSFQNTYARWLEGRWTDEEWEFESDIDQLPDTSQPRLLHHYAYRSDMDLLVSLLEYKQTKYGKVGAVIFWRSICKNNIYLVVQGSAARKLWDNFVTLGLQDFEVLELILNYAENLFNVTGNRWPGLYVTVVQHLLLNGRGLEALKWHHRLLKIHLPDRLAFLEMCRKVTLRKGDMAALLNIYKEHSYQGIYSTIIPILCDYEDYNTALKWHFMLIKRGDIPTTSKTTEPLMHFLGIYNRPKAVLVTQSLVDAGVPFAAKISSQMKENVQISREMMNLIHGETLNVGVHSYNDKLGARWFASSWISLDIAISSVHALGIQEIGPLSLQSIVLRELDCERVVLRLNQLRDLGISVGSSLFSRAVQRFARAHEQEYLHGLINSDQHPDTLENWKLQEELLVSFARNKDWPQYNRTIALRVIGSKTPSVEIENIVLREHLSRGDKSAMLATLSKMQLDGIPVSTRTIKRIVETTLRPRRSGRRPEIQLNQERDLDTCITVLRDIMMSGNYVPVTYWREVVRRLGMMGRFDELETLCVFLAEWFSPTSDSFTPGYSTTLSHTHKARVPAQVPTSHPLHPLKILFPKTLQMAIVEWGFIRALEHNHRVKAKSTELATHDDIPLPPIADGIIFLKRLHKLGVHIHTSGVRSAVLNRLVIYYGSGESDRLRNRVARASNPLSLSEMGRQVDSSLGGHEFSDMNLRQVIDRLSESKKRKQIEKKRRLELREPSSDGTGSGIY